MYNIDKNTVVEILHFWRSHSDEETRNKFNLSLSDLENVLENGN